MPDMHFGTTFSYFNTSFNVWLKTLMYKRKLKMITVVVTVFTFVFVWKFSVTWTLFQVAWPVTLQVRCVSKPMFFLSTRYKIKWHRSHFMFINQPHERLSQLGWFFSNDVYLSGVLIGTFLLVLFNSVSRWRPL